MPASGGGGVSFSIEPKFNLKDNLNIGLRFWGAAVVRDLVSNDNEEFTAKVAAIGSFVGTYDYYFH